MPGPAPDPNALRRDRKSDPGWTTLSSAEVDVPAPPWPLTVRTDRELELWADYWRKPQSRLWRHNRQEIEVALFVRRLAESEEIGSSVTLSVLVSKLADHLLLTIPAMYKARVKIAVDEIAAKRDEPKGGPRRLSARDRARADAG